MRYDLDDRMLVCLDYECAPYGLAVLGALPLEDRPVPFPTPMHPEKDQAGFSHLIVIADGLFGRDLWPCFRQSAFYDPRPQQDPLDRWTKDKVSRIAATYQAWAIFPFEGPPYYPFQRWAQQIDAAIKPSPLGVLFHPQAGVWWGLRAALLTCETVKTGPYRGARALELGKGTTAPDSEPLGCDHCVEKPCLQACPAQALAQTGIGSYPFDLGRCRRHIATDAGKPCWETGCLARHACPYGTPYPVERLAFHMRAAVQCFGG